MPFYKIPAKNKQGYRWECIKDGPTDPVTGKRKQIKRRGETKKEAEGKVDKIINNLVEHKIDEKVVKNLTFSMIADEWLKHYSLTGVKPGTIRLRKRSIEILNESIAARIIGKITSNTHEGILKKMFDEGSSKSHMEGVHVTANMIYEYAVRKKYLKDNPATGVKIPSRALTVEEIEADSIDQKFLERAELEEFLLAVRQHGLENDLEMFYLMAFSGVRSGELLALKETDFNYDTNRFRVTKTLYNPDNNKKKYELVTPKTKSSIRVCEVDPAVLSLVKNLIDNKLKLNFKDLIPDYHDKQFVFCGEDGYPLIQKTLIRRMNRILERTTIMKKATPHIFRHTYISIMAEAEVPLQIVMKQVGHEDAKTTLKIYTHVTEKMQQKSATKISESLSDIIKAITSDVA